ncbi:TRAP transporter small permease [Neomegalonema sp.]|uniref:TRAP transporter small permease n=1 Tax=Neomegalonema sp. TaxID=2039713 RepID=UPI00263794A9|nr:TRAP transporter small permease [Neomegalonema sp.]MDD2869356.1 TRAP transporter small permease [Neomegalonema sp.]
MPRAMNAAGRRRGPWDVVVRLSEGLLGLERAAVTLLISLLAGAILLNVATRYLGAPLYWIDEFAVYCMVWLTFIGASTMTRLRLDFAVTMMTERLPERGVRICRILSTIIVVAFGLALAAMCWLWFDPPGIAGAGFDARAFAGETFNFVYTERTQTLNWATWILYLILPVFALSMIIHGLANLMEDLGLVEKITRDLAINAEEAVN